MNFLLVLQPSRLGLATAKRLWQFVEAFYLFIIFRAALMASEILVLLAIKELNRYSTTDIPPTPTKNPANASLIGMCFIMIGVQ